MQPWTVWRQNVDQELCDRLQLDKFSLARLRREFWRGYGHLTFTEKRALASGGTCPRFAHMVAILRRVWTPAQWQTWLRYFYHTDRDIDEMCRGEYPISPYIVRVMSALFGIKADFMCLGSAPVADSVGVNIEMWPKTGIQ